MSGPTPGESSQQAQNRRYRETGSPDAAGLAASAGSACHSGAMTISHVLGAMGMTPDAARECVRFTFGWDTPPGTGTVAGALVAAAVRALR